MGALGGVINSVVGAASGSSNGTSLQDFLANFSSSDGALVKQIDPFQTFDVKFKFYPSDWKDDDKKSVLDKLGGAITSAAKSAVKNAVNNATGGLVGAYMNGKIDIEKLHKEFGKRGKHTFLEYLASASLLVGQEDWIGESTGQAVSPLELQLGLYCQSIQLPNMEIIQGGTSQNALGEFPINGQYVKCDSNVITMSILNTKVPLHERIFYPWMKEVTLPWWNYNSQPYTTATIIVDFTKHNDIKYVFCGCRPQKVIMNQATQEPTASMTRDVSFLFDYMMITSKLKSSESITDKLLSAGKTLVQGAGNLINM